MSLPSQMPAFYRHQAKALALQDSIRGQNRAVIYITGGKLQVVCPTLPEFVDWAKSNRGYWRRGFQYWDFPASQAIPVLLICRQLWGSDMVSIQPRRSSWKCHLRR